MEQDPEGPIYGLGVNPLSSDSTATYGITNPINPVATFVDTYGPFIRYFDSNQTEYGYNSLYDSKIDFTYSLNLGVKSTDFVIIDSDKVIISNSFSKVYMTKEQHYQRNPQMG